MSPTRELVPRLTTAQLARLGRLLWPDFVQVDGRVLRADCAASGAATDPHVPTDPSATECALNALCLADVAAGDGSEHALQHEAAVLAQMWEACFETRFSGRQFDVEVAQGERGPVISFHQRRPGEAESVPPAPTTTTFIPAPPTTDPLTGAQFSAALNLWWPELVEVDGCVLIRERYESANFQRWRERHLGDCTPVEAVLNETHLYDEVAGSGPLDLLEDTARRLAGSWEQRLARYGGAGSFQVEFGTEPDRYGPTVTFHRASPVPRRHHLDERGQTTAELLGILVLIALLIAALIGVGVPRMLAGGVRSAICQIARTACRGASSVASGGQAGTAPGSEGGGPSSGGSVPGGPGGSSVSSGGASSAGAGASSAGGGNDIAAAGEMGPGGGPDDCRRVRLPAGHCGIAAGGGPHLSRCRGRR